MREIELLLEGFKNLDSLTPFFGLLLAIRNRPTHKIINVRESAQLYFEIPF